MYIYIYNLQSISIYYVYIKIYQYINPGPFNPIKQVQFFACTAQVELMDLLGEEGIQNLPLLERLQHLDPGDEARV